MHQALGTGTHLIDTGLYGPKRAACYLIQDGDELALIDNGTNHTLPRILAAIAAIGATPEQMQWVIPTHVHLDHAGGTGAVMQACPNATLVVHPKGAPHMLDPSRLTAGAIAVYGDEAFARDFGILQAVPEERAILAEDGQIFTLGQRQLTFIHTPGHANHHGCIHDDASGFLFTGDTFGLGYTEFEHNGRRLVVATTTPVAFDPEGWFQSLEHMLALAPSSVCLTHFGAIPQPQDYVDMLRASIQAHVDIALAEEANGESGRSQRLRTAVDALLTGAAHTHCGIDVATARAIFVADIELNAQGLEIWLKRRAKRNA